ncbi:MAG: hypothetical protein HDS31_08065 [Bacteroides sp.]|nr:hypothetical protein [Bacteroides sp.]
MNDSTPQDKDPNESGNKAKKKRRHLIKPAWLRIPLKVLMWLVIAILLIPVLLYIPPIQTAVKNFACSYVKKSTGMDIEIERFLLKFPLDLQLDDVLIREASGDTMVMAKRLVADVKLRPLLDLDIKLKALRLDEGYYRMVSSDSSMILKLNAGLLDVESGSSFDLKNSHLSLKDALLRDGNVQLYMNVWKKDQTPDTTASSPFLIDAKKLRLENFTFGMAMLPTIDTLQFHTASLTLTDGVIDLGKNKITMGNVIAEKGSATYLVPTPEWVAAHPAPPADTTSTSAPMVIMADTIALRDFDAKYATAGAKPLPGFDASYIDFTDLTIALAGFYNESSTVRLPITALRGKERCGLTITSGSGKVLVDSTGLALDDLKVKTLYSDISATAALPFSLMAMEPSAPVDAVAEVTLGLPDLEAFMPDMAQYTAGLPRRTPVKASLKANGRLDDVDIPYLNVAMPDVLDLKASGHAANALDFKRLRASLKIDGTLKNPELAKRYLGDAGGVNIPVFNIKGTATADAQTYGADLALTTPDGNVGARGKVSMTSEHYDADVIIQDLDLAKLMPSLGIGSVDGSLIAKGSGFNPENPRAYTDVKLNLNHIDYNKTRLTGITADATLNDGAFTLDAISHAAPADFSVSGSGRIAPDLYDLNMVAHINHLDLKALGMSETVNEGSGSIRINGTASPKRWLYDARVNAENIDWTVAETNYHLPIGLQLDLKATELMTLADLTANQAQIHFSSPRGLEGLIDSFSKAATMATAQIDRRNLEVDSLHNVLPPFRLEANIGGKGILDRVLAPEGIALDTVYATIVNDSVISARIGAFNLAMSSMNIDTIGLDMKQRGNLLDYAIHMGNRPGTLDEFANVNASGYIGANRLSTYLIQRNIKGETGYRLGFTAAVADSTVSLHFTPLSATIAYMPWKFNMENFIDYNLFNRKVQADMTASSAKSSILVRTEPFVSPRRDENGHVIAGDSLRGEELHLKLTNIVVEDFLKLSPTAPPITGNVDSDIRVFYDGRNLMGRGSFDFTDFFYERQRVGNFQLGLMAGLESSGKTRAAARLRIDSIDALTLRTTLVPDSGANGGLEPQELKLKINRLPLAIANPFLGADVARLGGVLEGNMDVSGKFSAPILNGSLKFDGATVYVPMIGTTLTLDSVPIAVKDNALDFDNYDIWGVNKNPLTINGSVNAANFSNIKLDLSANAQNMQLVGNTKNARSDVYGKLFFNLGATAKGTMQMMDITADLNILPTTDVTYVMESEEVLQQNKAEDVVKFVSFADTTQVVKADSLERSMLMRINANLTLSQGMKATVLLDAGGSDRVEVTPSGTLRYTQNYMGEMRLNGQVQLGTGFVRYTIPVMGEKRFDFKQGSVVTFSGPIDNPSFNIAADDKMKVNVTNGQTTRMVNFDVGLNITNNLAAPKVLFDLTTEDDMSIANELASLSPEQRSTTAMNLLITGQYTGPGAKTVSGNLVTGTALGLLTSQLNSLAAKAIKGVDLSFGVDQYQQGENGQSSTATSYSYQLSKSLFNNRFKIVVGGNYSTDASADENLEENLVSDISFEYIIRQTNTMSLAGKLYRHNGYENILEGEVTETGIGLILRRRLSSLSGLFHFGLSKKRKEAQRLKKAAADSAARADSVATKVEETTVPAADNKKGGDK